MGAPNQIPRRFRSHPAIITAARAALLDTIIETAAPPPPGVCHTPAIGIPLGIYFALLVIVADDHD